MSKEYTGSFIPEIWSREWMKNLYADALFHVRMSFLSEHWNTFFSRMSKISVQEDIDFCVKYIKFGRKHGLLERYKPKEG